MQYRLDLKRESSPAWISSVMENFDCFLQDHANCERKASAMAMSFVAKYPDRDKIIPQLIDTGVEELEHFRQVYDLMKARGVPLEQQMKPDEYVNRLIDLCRSGREERFVDRLLVASVVECRGAERFRRVYENLTDKQLKDFYHGMWAADARHADLFVTLALEYFNQDEVYNRLDELNNQEAEIIEAMDVQPALH